LQIFGYLTKPWSFDHLKETVSRAFQHYNLIAENKRLQQLTHAQNRQLSLVNENLENLVQKRTVQLEEAVREGVVMLAMAAEAKDDDTGDHVHRIQRLTRKICIGLKMSSEESEQISFFSIMHDVGKIHIPDRISKKPEPLTDKEWDFMRTHSIAGEKILGNKPFYQTAREIARSHHERWDGNGYPDGLKGKSIPLAARIVTVADVFDALTHKRPYKPAWTVEAAIEEMKTLSGKVFDPKILNIFVRMHAKKLKT
jgi:putative two-component system response regulator